MVKPLKRSKNPFVRMLNLDCASGVFQTQLRNIREVEPSLIGLAQKLAGKIK